ncbi:uncharacterized protein G2W53_033897 [Senna tora]|uniref:Uncharacterized protein n=1 Tax=Senna tora TaxID=362788 RepID=A0A834T0E1_9FABA|nr:uncharacterized protein G2W53_033897 [Senna tora]
MDEGRRLERDLMEQFLNPNSALATANWG